MENKMCLEQTQHILNATRETVDQGLSLQRLIVEKFKKRVLDEPYASCEPPKRRSKVTNSDIIAESYSESNAETDITKDSDIIAESHSESNAKTNITEDSNIIAGSHSESNAKTNITEDSEIIAGSHSESNEETDTEVINITEDNAEIESLIQNERDIRKKFWTQSKTKKENLKRTICHRATRLEAHISYESKSFNLERTFAIDTVIYILNRLFKFHQDVLDSGWIELTTPHTKKHKFDGLFKVIRTNLKNQVIIVVEFSSGRKASLTKEHNDHVKLCQNAMRTLNVVLQTIPREKARIYLVQFVSNYLIKDSYLKIEYMIRPLPSVYLLNCFMCTKVPETFNDFKKFSKDMAELINWQADVLIMTKEINKIPYMARNNNVCTTPLEDTPKKNKKVIKKANDSYPGSPYPGSPGFPLI
ncbi:hypothetical protein C2G38_2141096 [Gigaspora rosea]|uniref:Uncharacterized protein n=1 Tax=Gigaspora rosea TaxID=44941 RepID=A0A397VHX0_9GLOM|nr:hypothetical protein C2G38_2141096 [Gigaspora rosea]